MELNALRRTLVATAASGLWAAGLPAWADCPRFSTFEGGTLDGWVSAANGGGGTTGVQAHNGSNMAYAQQTGGISRTISCDAPYVAGALVEFDMHAIANASGGGTQAASGVVISLLNAFNAPLGSFAIYNTTSAALLGSRDLAVDGVQHHYASTMGSFAAQAGVAPGASIAKISLSFTAYAQTNVFSSSSSVWFDNVSVPTAVPEPGSSALFLAGLAATAMIGTRRRSVRRSEER